MRRSTKEALLANGRDSPAPRTGAGTADAKTEEKTEASPEPQKPGNVELVSQLVCSCTILYVRLIAFFEGHAIFGV